MLKEKKQGIEDDKIQKTIFDHILQLPLGNIYFTTTQQGDIGTVADTSNEQLTWTHEEVVSLYRGSL